MITHTDGHVDDRRWVVRLSVDGERSTHAAAARNGTAAFNIVLQRERLSELDLDAEGTSVHEVGR